MAILYYMVGFMSVLVVSGSDSYLRECGENPMKNVHRMAGGSGKSLMFLLSKMRSADENAFESLSQQMRGYASCISRVDTSYFRKRSSSPSSPSPPSSSSSSSAPESGRRRRCDLTGSDPTTADGSLSLGSSIRAACLVLMTSHMSSTHAPYHSEDAAAAGSYLHPRGRDVGRTASACEQYKLCERLLLNMLT